MNVFCKGKAVRGWAVTCEKEVCINDCVRAGFWANEVERGTWARVCVTSGALVELPLCWAIKSMDISRAALIPRKKSNNRVKSKRKKGDEV